MPKVYNKKFVLVPTYTPEHLLSEDAKYLDERPLIHIAIDIDWLRRDFSSWMDTISLEEYLDTEATYDSFEDTALRALLDGWFAFAVYDNGEEEKVIFPERENFAAGSMGSMMRAYHEYMREETIFDHICRKAKDTPYNTRKGCHVGFMVDQGRLVFSDSDPTRYANTKGAEQAFIDILTRCGEPVLHDENWCLYLAHMGT